MKNVIRAAALGGLAMLSPICNAGPYFGAAGVLSTYEYDDVDNSVGFQGFLGYRVASAPILFEVGYQDSGEADLPDIDFGGGDRVHDMALNFTGYSFMIGYASVPDFKGSSVWAKIGYYSGDASINSLVDSSSNGINNYPVEFKEKSTGFTWALGGELRLSPDFGLRGEMGALSGVKDLPEVDSSNKSDITQFSLGVVMHFGGRRTVDSAGVPLPPAAPLPMASTPAPATPVASLPPPPPAGPTTAGEVTLRAQPKARTSPVSILPAGTPLTIQGRMSNTEGDWVYVAALGKTGWLVVSEIRQPYQ